MNNAELNVVTGAFGFTGKYVTSRLLAMGKRLKTLTGHTDRPNPFGDQVAVAPYNFDNSVELAKSLEGTATLYNTYWIRFPHGAMTYEKAVENTRTLIKAAEHAGVRRLVHVSIANATESTLPYYKGKAALEGAIKESKLSYAIIRPTVLFGPEDILINNIAWFLRRYPAFIAPGSGEYGMQPIYVEDFADILVEAGQSEDNIIADAAGPEAFTFNDLLALIKDTVQSKTRIIHLNPAVALQLVKMLNTVVSDVVLTDGEIKGLMDNLLVSHEPPKGRTNLREWLAQNVETVGKEYHSELARHYR
ncbi:MAG: NAD(P)H-binding protein [Armatimonadota bacterium]|nr:NAD(P)H-binding protein [Armatimonadota bacterium]